MRESHAKCVILGSSALRVNGACYFRPHIPRLKVESHHNVRLGRRLPTHNPALSSANESSQTLMKVGLRHRTPVNVVFVGNFQHVEKLPTFDNERW